MQAPKEIVLTCLFHHYITMWRGKANLLLSPLVIFLVSLLASIMLSSYLYTLCWKGRLAFFSTQHCDDYDDDKKDEHTKSHTHTL